MEGSSCAASAAERELARRSHILNRLIERSRSFAQQDYNRYHSKVSSPGRFEPETSLFYRASPQHPSSNEYEEDLKHLHSLRAEVEEIAKRHHKNQQEIRKAENDNNNNNNSDKKSVSVSLYAPPRRGNGDANAAVPRLVRSSSLVSDGVVRRQNAAVLEGKRAPSPAVWEVDLAAVAALLKVRVKAADMPAALQERAFKCARQCLDSMDKLNSKRVALVLKKEFDTSYGHAWHCIVGTSFGSFVTHSLGGFLYFSLDKVSILLFKTTVEPMDQ